MTNRFVKFFETIGHDLKAIFSSTTWETKTLATISYAEPFVDGILTLADPSIEPIVAAAIAEVKAALTTVKNVVQGGTVAPGSTEAQKVTAALGSIKSNLSSLLTDAHIKNATKVKEITAAVDVVNGEVDAILAEVPPSSPIAQSA